MSKDVIGGQEIRIGERGGVGDRGAGNEETNNTSDIPSDIASDSTITTATESTATGVPSGSNQLSGERSGATSGDRQLPTWLNQSSEDLELQYWKGFKERCNRVFRELQKSDGQLVRDIFRFEDPKEYDDFIKCIQRDQYYRRGLFQVCREATHVHVVHDCNFSNGTCRCDWWKKAKTYGSDVRRDKRGHRRDTCRSRTLADIQSLLFYYCTKGRKIVYQKIGGQVERLPREGYNLSESGPDKMREVYGQMEIQIPGDGTQLHEWGPNLEDDEPDETISYAVPKRKRRKLGAQERIQIRVMELLEQFPICPPEAIVKHHVWRTDPELRFKDLSHKEIKAAISCFKDQMTTMSMKEYKDKFYSKPNCNPVFAAGYGNFENYYYNIANSLQIMNKLISYQFDDDEDAILDFVTTLYNVLERKCPKLNTIVVCSPPSAGKNFFFDAIKSYYINCGHLCNANKYNNFPFQDAEGRRLVFWNEPNYSPEFLEPIKEILGGDSTSVNVKYQHDTPVYRTPVIVTTNNVVSFMTHDAFKDRIRVYNWSSCPMLKDCDKKPNPLAVYDFFKSFGLVE